MKNLNYRMLLAFVAFAASVNAGAQSFQSQFRKSFQSGDTIAQSKVLAQWEKASPKDPELFTSFYNYYFQKSKKEVLSITATHPKGESLVLTDEKDKTTGYLGSSVSYQDRDLRKAFEKIDRGIALHPDRLDMRFGKVYGLGLIEDWPSFTNEIIKAVRHSAKNGNNWTWTNDEKRDDGKEFFLSSIQGYQVQLYKTERDELLPNMRQIAEEVLKVYPDHVQSLSNLSVTYALAGDHDKALEPLLRAEKIDPKDYIVLSNIAGTYRKKGDKAKAKEYYEKVHLYGDQDAKDFAKQRLEELNK